MSFVADDSDRSGVTGHCAVAQPERLGRQAGREGLGEVRGRVVDLTEVDDQIRTRFDGRGVIAGVAVRCSGTLTYQGTKVYFSGRLTMRVTDRYGVRLATIRGVHFGRHLERPTEAELRAVATLRPTPRGRHWLEEGDVVADIFVAEQTDFRCRLAQFESRDWSTSVVTSK